MNRHLQAQGFTFDVLRITVGITLPLTEESARAILKMMCGEQIEDVEMKE